MIYKNDVIQITPSHKWAGCFAAVDEVKEWGVQAFVQLPEQGQAYIRLKNEDFVKIGHAAYVLDNE